MYIDAKQRFRRLFRLRTILLVVMLSVLFLPLSSLFFFRFYENELVRKTENELIMQSAVFATVYRELIGKNTIDPKSQYTPIEPQLDFSSQKILPRRPAGIVIDSTQLTFNQKKAIQAGQRMQRILFNSQRITLAGIRILDSTGVVVAGRGELGESFAHVFEVKQALEGRYISVFRERISDEPPPSIASLSRGTGVRVFTAFPIIDRGEVYGVVYLSRTPKNILKHLYTIKEKVLLILVLLFVVTGLIVLFISSRLSRPIRELIEQSQRVTRGELDTVEVIRQPGTYELSELSNSFSEMSQALYERSQYIQQFASHVSHEFKTPLTSMQGSLELLLEHNDDMKDEQRLHFLNNLQKDTERLKNLVSRLLEQARADALHRTTEFTAILSVLKEFQSSYLDENFKLKFSTETDYYLKISADSLHDILRNLFDNSFQHGANCVEISFKENKGDLEIAIRDNGSGISEANKKRIFTPFFTTRRETGGTGLGLGIIESILKAENGSIKNLAMDEADNNDKSHIKGSIKDKGALFVITLKLSL